MTNQWAIAAITSIAFVASAGLNYLQIGKINGFVLQEKLIQAENRLLKDQIRDLDGKIARDRTYEQGLTDGLVRSKSVGYVDGYHSAMAQVSEVEAMKYQVEEERRLSAEKRQQDSSQTALPAKVGK